MCNSKLALTTIPIQHDTSGPSSLSHGSTNCFYQKMEGLEYSLEYSPLCAFFLLVDAERSVTGLILLYYLGMLAGGCYKGMVRR